MAISRLTGQDAKGATTGATTVVATYPGATTANNLLIASVWCGGATAPTITGWTGATIGMNGTTAQLGLFFKLATGTETTVTANLTGTVIGKIHIYEYTGNANPISLDVALTTNGNSTTGVTTFDTSTINTTDPTDLIFATLGVNGTATTPAWTLGLTMLQQDATTLRLWDGNAIPGSTQTGFKGTSTWTNTLKPSAIIVAFKGASSTPIATGNLISAGAMYPYTYNTGGTARKYTLPLTGAG